MSTQLLEVKLSDKIEVPIISCMDMVKVYDR